MLKSSWYGIRCPTSSSLQPNLSMDLSLQEVLTLQSQRSTDINFLGLSTSSISLVCNVSFKEVDVFIS